MIDTMSARWAVMETDAALELTIELWNNHRIALTVWKDDAAQPFVALRGDGGEHDLAEVTAGDFRRWLDAAQGKRAR